MAVATLYVVHGINTPSNFYGQIENGRVVTGSEILTIVPSGHFYPMFQAVASQDPAIEFTTTDIATLLGETGLTGVGLTGNLDFYGKKVTNLGTRTADASSAHERFRVTESLFYTASISAPHNGEATADARVAINYDGTNEPIIPLGGQALAGNVTTPVSFGAGPVELNNTLIGGVQNIGVEFAVTIIKSGGESEPWNTFTAIESIIPIFTIQTLTATSLTSYGIDGTAISSQTAVYLRKKAADGVNVAIGTNEHIEFVIGNGIILVDEVGGGGGKPVESTIRIIPRATNVTAAPVAIDTTAVIPAS